MKFLIIFILSVLVVVEGQTTSNDGLDFSDVKTEEIKFASGVAQKSAPLENSHAEIVAKLELLKPYFSKALELSDNKFITRMLQKTLKMEEKPFDDVLIIAKAFMTKAVETGDLNLKEFSQDPKIQQLRAEITPEQVKAAVKYATNFFTTMKKSEV